MMEHSHLDQRRAERQHDQSLLGLRHSGQRIGIYGGTFDPPHAGHLHVSEEARRRLKLDRVWWILGPTNPEKEQLSFELYRERVAQARRFTAHYPKIVVVDVKEFLALRYTYQVLQLLRRRAPNAFMVWIMGEDCWRAFHQWNHPEVIMETLPVCIVDRPSCQDHCTRVKASQQFRDYARDLTVLGGKNVPLNQAWVYLRGKGDPHSSTELRAQRFGQKGKGPNAEQRRHT